MARPYQRTPTAASGAVYRAAAMLKVSVIVPVFDPGERIDRCIESLLGQSMPAGEYEVVFVDDGSTDGTGERLAAARGAAPARHDRADPELRLARPAAQRRDRHRARGVRLLRRPRRLDRARGARAALRHRGRRRGRHRDRQGGRPQQGRAAQPVPRERARPRHARRAVQPAHAAQAVPPRAARRARDPLPRRPAPARGPHDGRARRTSRRAGWRSSPTTPATTGSTGPRARTPPTRRPTPPTTSPTCARCSTSSTSTPSRASSATRSTGAGTAASCSAGSAATRSSGAPEEHRRRVLAEVAELIEERFPPRLDAPLVYNFKLRAALARRRDYDGLVALAELERDLKASARIRAYRGDGTWMTLELECWLRDEQHEPLTVVRRGGRILWPAPEPLRAALEPRRARRHRRARATGACSCCSSATGDETDWLVPAEVALELPDAPDGEPVRPAIVATARIAPTIAAAGPAARARRLRAARGDLDRRLLGALAGAARQADVRRHGHARRPRLPHGLAAGAPAAADAAAAAGPAGQADARSTSRTRGTRTPSSRLTARRSEWIPRRREQPRSRAARSSGHAFAASTRSGSSAPARARTSRRAPAAGRARPPRRRSRRSARAARCWSGSSPSTTPSPVGSVSTRRQIRSGRWRASTPSTL